MTMKPNPEELWTLVHGIVADLVSANGIDAADITRESMATELGLSSVDTIHMMIILEERLGDNLDLEPLVMHDGEYVTDLSLRDLHELLCRQLGLPA